MFDMLTREELSELHHGLCLQHKVLYYRMTGHGDTPGLSPLSPEWDQLDAESAEISAQADIVWAEMEYRDRLATEARVFPHEDMDRDDRDGVTSLADAVAEADAEGIGV